MKQLFQCGLATSLVFLQFTSIYASYCKDSSSCCAFNGLTKETCPGSGTSDVIDLVGYMYKGDGQILISGAEFGIYFVWGVNNFWLQGAFANLFVNTLFAYILEIPKSNYTEHTYFVIEVTGCPTMSILTSETKGTLATTSFPFTTLYEVVRSYATSDLSCPGPCNLVPASYETKYPDFFNALAVGQSSISLFLNNVISFEYRTLKGCSKRNPLKVAQQYGLRVKKGACPNTYILADYPNNVTQKCGVPTPRKLEGTLLVEQGFNFTQLYEHGGLCALSVAVGKMHTAVTSYSYLLTNRRATLLREPYEESFTLNVLVQSNNAYIAFQPFWDLC